MSPPQYPHETIEAQIRLLADTAFAIGDLETALAHYRLARDDFKRDRALLHAGAAHEMIARSLLGLAVRGSGGSIVVSAATSASGADTKAATSVLWRDAIALQTQPWRRYSLRLARRAAQMRLVLMCA